MNRSQYAFACGARGRGRRTSSDIDLSASSTAGAKMASRSWTMNRPGRVERETVPELLDGPCGRGVLGNVPVKGFRRVCSSRMTKTYRRWNVAVTTTKKSQAKTAPEWFRRNAAHDCVDRPPSGLFLRRMYRRTVRGETVSPSFTRSSAAMRSSPRVRFAAAMSAIGCCSSDVMRGRPRGFDLMRQKSR